MEVLEHHSTQSDGSQHVKASRFVSASCASVLRLTPAMALVGAGEVLAVACHLAEVTYALISSRALHKKVQLYQKV